MGRERRRAMMIVGGILLLSAVTGLRGASKPAIIVVRRPTVVAFFAPSAKPEVALDFDSNAALDDFQFYAGRTAETLAKLSIDFKVVYTRSFRISVSGKITTFVPGPDRVGYYFIAPGKKPRIQEGVDTDDGLLQIAKEYFGVGSK